MLRASGLRMRRDSARPPIRTAYMARTQGSYAHRGTAVRRLDGTQGPFCLARRCQGLLAHEPDPRHGHFPRDFRSREKRSKVYGMDLHRRSVGRKPNSRSDMDDHEPATSEEERAMAGANILLGVHYNYLG
jgi:hypothetical protein